MADLKLKALTLRNWMKFGKVQLDFPREGGLIMVVGQNTASNGALMSVGSGKTGLGEALSRTLLGVPGRFTHAKSYSTDEKGDTYVRVEAEFRGKELIVESGYRCQELGGPGEALRFHFDGKKIERGLISQTRDELTRVLGVSPLLAAWTVFVDGDGLRFNRLSEDDRVELVMTALRQPPWNEFHAKAKKAAGTFRQQLAEDEATHAQLARDMLLAQTNVNTALTDYEQVKQEFQESKAEFEQERKTQSANKAAWQAKLSKGLKRIAAIRKEITVLTNKNAKAAYDLEIQIRTIEQEVTVLEANRETLQHDSNQAQHRKVQAEQKVAVCLDSDKPCPTCNRPMGEPPNPKEVATLKKQVEKATKHYLEARKVYTSNETTIAEKRRSIQRLRERLRTEMDTSKVEDLRDEVEQIEQDNSQYRQNVHQCELALASGKEPSRTPIDRSKATLEERQRVLKETKTALAAAAAVLAESKATMSVFDYWVTAFSPYGIPNMVLADAIAPLNREAQRVSSILTGGTIEVRYGTTKVLASGKEKATLNIEVNNRLGSRNLNGSSKGETGLSNLVIAETLAEVGQIPTRIGYRWYDEIVPHQDPVVCRNIYSHMRQTALRMKVPFFLVDHNPVAANYADHVLVIEKKKVGQSAVSSAHWR